MTLILYSSIKTAIVLRKVSGNIIYHIWCENDILATIYFLRKLDYYQNES